MNILFINTFYSVGGAALLMNHLGEELRKEGHTVRYIIGYTNAENIPTISAIEHGHVSTFFSRVTHKNFNYFFNDLRSQIIANDIDYGVSNDLLTHPWVMDADIIHCNNLHGSYFNLNTLIGLSKMKPVVWTLNDMWAATARCAYSLDCQKWKHGCEKCPYLQVHQKMYWDNVQYLWQKKKEIYNHSLLHIVTQSHWLQNIVKQSILKHQSLHNFYCGIDTRLYHPQNKINSKGRLGLPSNKTIITFAADGGKRNPWKGWEFIEKIVQEYKNNEEVLFLCIGGTPKDSKVNIRNVQYVPYIADEKILAKYLAASDLLLLPSLADNLPLTALSSLACGTPVVGFNVGGIKEVVKDGITGYVANYQNVKDFRSKIDTYLRCSVLSKRTMQKNCRSIIVKKFSRGLMTEKYIRLYRILLDTSRPAAVIR